MAALKARKAVLEQALQGLLCISGDTDEALRQARSQLTQMKDDDSDSEGYSKEWSEERAEQCPQHAIDERAQNGVHTHANQHGLSVYASENYNLQRAEPQLAGESSIVYGDNNNEEDMSLASEDEGEDEEYSIQEVLDFGGYEEEEPLVERRGEAQVKEDSTVQSFEFAQALQAIRAIQATQATQALHLRGPSTSHPRHYSFEDPLEIHRGGEMLVKGVSTTQSMQTIQTPQDLQVSLDSSSQLRSQQYEEGEEDDVVLERRGEEAQAKDFSSTIQTNLPGFSDTTRQGPLNMTNFPPLSGRAGGMYEVRIVSAIKNEVPLLTKINPALQVDVARLCCDPDQGPLFWSLQVECAEHQVCLPPTLSIRF
jgi:hypothetical protein